MKACSKCGREWDVAFELCGECGTWLPHQTVDEVVAAWRAGEHTMSDVVHQAPGVAWAAILRVLEADPKEEEMALLAAGPLESLLAAHGQQFIDQAEREAAENPRFAHLLGGVWRNQMAAEIWARVQKARKETW